MLPLSEKAIALNLKYPNETVKHVAVEEDADNSISAADLVVYGFYSYLSRHFDKGYVSRNTYNRS